MSFPRKHVFVTLTAVGAVAAMPQAGFAQYLGPSPYRSAADSPFNGIGFSYFYLENFEDGALNTPGVSASAGVVAAPSVATDSVDGDDGIVDGLGQNGRSYFSDFAVSGFTFTFSAAALGGLPTHVGLVWTDVGFSTAPTGTGFGDVTFEAFDAANVSLGVFGPFPLGDGQVTGQSAEDRFFGVAHAGGIASVRMTMPSSTDWEVDHLQYGHISAAPQATIPEPGTGALATMGLFSLVGAALRQRRQRKCFAGEPTQPLHALAIGILNSRRKANDRDDLDR
jgi:hypothetical protein